MFLECILYISILLSTIFLMTHYVTRTRKPLSVESPLSNKLLHGFTYGMIGVSMMYIHQALTGHDYADPRQIAVILAFFYGGWIPALLSSAIIFAFRAWVFTNGSNLLILACSMILTLSIAQLVMWSKINRSKQWYILTVVTMIEIYFTLRMLNPDTHFFNAKLLHFALSFLIGSIVAYHFKELLRQSYFTIQELKRSKEELQKAESNYRLIAEHSSDLIAVVGIDNLALFLSPSHQVILGMNPSDHIGRPVGELVHPEDIVYLRPSWQQAIQEGKASHAIYRFRHADGHWVWIESYYVPIVCVNGEVEKIIVTSRDITERKETEEIIRNTEKLSVVGELAAGIAHEIRNPLTTLKGFTQMMKEDPSLYQPNVLDLLFEELNRIDLITNELLYLAKPQAQEIRAVSVKVLLHQLQTLLQPQALLQNIILSVKVEGEFPPIEGVENRLKQVCINLVKNAMDAMPKGGEIIIKAKEENQETLLLSIQDHGIGIPEDRMDKLGQPFYSLKEKGTGLGLTICKKIIQEHHGSMTFHSIVGVGTTVDVRLPLLYPSTSLEKVQAH